MKRVLLTGGGGSIGVHFIAHIMHNTDWFIVATDSFRHKGEFDRITEVCSDHPEWKSRLKLITHDLTAPFTEREISQIGKINYVINLASLSDVGASIVNPTPFALNNILITLNMLDYARGQQLEAFVQFSTDEVYGSAKKDASHPEWSPIKPSNAYAASKASQEAFAIAEWSSHGLPLIITNTMNNFGEMQQSGKYPVKIQRWLANGEPITVHSSSSGEIGSRYYIHSRNVADAVLFILGLGKPYVHKLGEDDWPDRYNIVGLVQRDNKQLADDIAQLMGIEPQFNFVNFHEEHAGHDLHYGLSGKKLYDLGWREPVNYLTSLKNTIEWQKSHPEWIDVDNKVSKL